MVIRRNSGRGAAVVNRWLTAHSALILQVTVRGGAMAAGAEFVEGWLVAQVLGEGAYGEYVTFYHFKDVNSNDYVL